MQPQLHTCKSHACACTVGVHMAGGSRSGLPLLPSKAQQWVHLLLSISDATLFRAAILASSNDGICRIPLHHARISQKLQQLQHRQNRGKKEGEDFVPVDGGSDGICMREKGDMRDGGHVSSKKARLRATGRALHVYK